MSWATQEPCIYYTCESLLIGTNQGGFSFKFFSLWSLTSVGKSLPTTCAGGNCEARFLQAQWNEHTFILNDSVNIFSLFLIKLFRKYMQFASIHLTLLVSLKYFFFSKIMDYFFHIRMSVLRRRGFTEPWVRYSMKRESARLPVFLPEKQDYLFRRSAGTNQKVMFHLFSNRIFRKIFVNGD